MSRAVLLTLLASIVLAGGCQRRSDDTPVVVSAIGSESKAADPSRGRMAFPDAALMAATAQGLVRFDAVGQVEPGLAERWIVIDDGRSYIFRIGDAEWADGTQVTAAAVVRALDRARAPGSSNPLSPYLQVVSDVREMTPQVVEIELKQPRPDFLRLLALPDLAIFETRTLSGSGPFRIRNDTRAGRLLVPVQNRPADDEDEVEPSGPEEQVRLVGEHASLAIARFEDRRSDAVFGGTFRDWPILQISQVPQNVQRIDPATGLFGLLVVERQGFLADARNRAAIAMAIDRNALTGAFRPDWPAVETILPQQLDSARAPVPPEWMQRSLDDRRATARASVLVWKTQRARETDSPAPPIRVALPAGPGGNLVWNHIARALNAIGLSAQRVEMRADADLRLIDRVAPTDNARWYLRTVCGLCSDDTMSSIDAARDAPDLADRAQRLAEADAAVTAEAAYIPIAQPLRWSLVAPRLSQWQPNALAWHPLNHLRNDTR